MPPQSLKEMVAVRQTSDNEFQSVHPPSRMGNSAPIAYGGCTLSIATSSAYATVKPGYHAYSLLGHFLGPALTDRVLHTTVRRIRDTRTFATRQVDVSQILDSGERRLCLTLTADFQVAEPSLASLTYSTPPSRLYSKPEEIPSLQALRRNLVDQGKIPQKLADLHANMFGLTAALFESRPAPEGIFAQNLYGMAKSLPTSQDGLPLTQRTSGDWMRARPRQGLDCEATTMAALAFLMDGAISFVPLSHDHKFFDDVGACSSLDFALRFFVGGAELDLERWHLRELGTVAGAAGRTFSESRLWDEEGRLVCGMSQQCAMRVKAEGKGRAKL